jgi:hypothetical protein
MLIYFLFVLTSEFQGVDENTVPVASYVGLCTVLLSCPSFVVRIQCACITLTYSPSSPNSSGLRRDIVGAPFARANLGTSDV